MRHNVMHNIVRLKIFKLKWLNTGIFTMRSLSSGNQGLFLFVGVLTSASLLCSFSAVSQVSLRRTEDITPAVAAAVQWIS